MLFHRRQAETVAIPYRAATLRHAVLAKNDSKVRDLEVVRDLHVCDLERIHCICYLQSRCTGIKTTCFLYSGEKEISGFFLKGWESGAS